MKQIITAKLKLHTTKEEKRLLRQTQLAYRDGANYVSKYAFEHGKASNQKFLQKSCYNTLRMVYKLPAQIACNVPRQVSGTMKSLWTKVYVVFDLRYN